MANPKSLADFLAVEDPRTPEQQATAAERPSEPTLDGAVDITDPTEFCKRILMSREWRQMILRGVILGDLSQAIATRIMDHGMGKPPERVEHTGKNGGPIAVTEVRRVIVRPEKNQSLQDKFERDDGASTTNRTH